MISGCGGWLRKFVVVDGGGDFFSSGGKREKEEYWVVVVVVVLVSEKGRGWVCGNFGIRLDFVILFSNLVILFSNF